MLDRNILKKLKRKVLRACVTQACLNLYLETVALTEQQQQLKVGSWFCRITRTKRVDERKMNDPDEICDATKQFNRKIGEKQGEMGRPHGKDGCRHTSEENGRER